MRFKTNLKSSFSLIDLTPLIDVVFLILIFFMVTSEILPLKSLYITNPEIADDSEAKTSRLLLVMDAENVIYLGSKKRIVDFPSLREELLAVKGDNSTLVLSIDKRVEYEHVLKLIAIAEEVFPSLRLVYHHADH